jgi:hypothetical protein
MTGDDQASATGDEYATSWQQRPAPPGDSRHLAERLSRGNEHGLSDAQLRRAGRILELLLDRIQARPSATGDTGAHSARVVLPPHLINGPELEWPWERRRRQRELERWVEEQQGSEEQQLDTLTPEARALHDAVVAAWNEGFTVGRDSLRTSDARPPAAGATTDWLTEPLRDAAASIAETRRRIDGAFQRLETGIQEAKHAQGHPVITLDNEGNVIRRWPDGTSEQVLPVSDDSEA